jgi:hypothetical protein
MCPYCRRNAPLVYRGVVPYCTGCGALRAPLAAPSVNMAGKPHKVGGTVARVFGWLILVFGVVFALLLGLLTFAFSTATAALIVGLLLGVPTLAVSIALLKSGRSLEQSGAGAERATREQAAFALASHRGGFLTAAQVAEALAMRVDEADLLLTNMAKQQPDLVSLEIDDHGGIYFRFPNAMPAAPHVRVETARARVGVDDRAEESEVERDASGRLARSRGGAF